MATGPLAITLLQELLEWLPYGRVFTTEQALDAGRRLGLSSTHVLKLLSEMTSSGTQLLRPRQGLYVMRPPFGGRDDVRAISVAVRAAEPAAVAGQSALVHWGLIEQAPLKYETLVTPTRIRWSGTEHRGQLTRWKWEGQTFEYRHIPAREMFGIRLARVDSETEVPMFDRERCLLEEALRAPMSAATILADHRDEIDHHRLASYARKQGEPAVALIEGLMGRLALAA